MKHKQVFSMNLTGPIDYGFRNDYMFRAALQLSQKALIGLISSQRFCSRYQCLVEQ